MTETLFATPARAVSRTVHSCLYEGMVRHRRFAPVENRFRYRLFMIYLDLDELPHLFARRLLWSNVRPNLASFRRRDHLGDPDQPLDQSVRDLVEQQTGRRPAGPIRLLTHLSYFGYRFNPVSFYFCFAPQGGQVETLVAEVNNTPWNEQHCYVLPESLDQSTLNKKHYRFDKAFHVDETLMYSCAVFPHEDSTLEEASIHKNERICRKLGLGSGDHLLEIGTGWGGFALHAAQRYGCRVTTTTLSHEQYELARERIRRAGLQDRIEVLRRDYRDLKGRYDKLVSIEMIEAVGHQYFNTYFRQCSQLLKPDGLMLLQAITISDWAFEAHKHTVDFIKRYIFPGSCIPSVAAIGDSLSRVTDMRLFHLEDIGPHYARTLREWRLRFLDHLDQVRAMGFPEEFIRLWEFYLCYCEAGFAERYLSDAQLLLAKPGNRRTPILPELNG